MSGYKYGDLIKLGTQYARRMNYLSNRIFGEVARETNPKSMKVVRMYAEEPIHKRDYVVNWYPRHVETHILMKNLRAYGLFRDEHQDFKEEMKRVRKLRGKAAPKKGEGKRAQKK
ncbi:28S ribosomal protein S33, mitochondrial-like [Teleopsis dalmanni]|uniref:28S ribosomal protein S33, mitochondrial-like n=1 Tax=Teleopsis dalmanni TaxID=139649 RepID=UPI0018CD7EB5|nr:28S ribosomal protein S33, mitochondrial-like [Teleopsis dalmanni]XP_037954394.1 28S ribosomal protein S33, mitochondrial-like [Teleopsis dalmanni]